MVNFVTAKLDPASIFKKPSEVLKDQTLSRAQKIDILKRWAYDEREMAVAEEENMQNTTPGDNSILDEILKCLLELGVDGSDIVSPPTKQG